MGWGASDGLGLSVVGVSGYKAGMNSALRLGICALATCLLFAGPSARGDGPPAAPLKSVKTYMAQFGNLDRPGAIDRLAHSGYDMLIVDPTFNIKGTEDFDAKAMVKALHDGKPGRIVLAYMSIGEAERFRTYWGADWHVPPGTADEPVRPGYLLGPDPDGDEDCFVVRYWRSRWQNLFVGKNGLVDKLMADGFDGVYLDHIEVYDDDVMDDAADRDKIQPATAMVTFISAIRARVRKANPNGLVVVQDAPYLEQDEPKYLQAVDGVLFQETWFGGRDAANWTDADAGDIPNTATDEASTANLVKEFKKYLTAGLPVFTLDFCIRDGNASKVYRLSSANGFVPLVTRSSMDDMTPTPPANLPAQPTNIPAQPANLPATQP
jgi:cysteinyl-tRNA synthetase, unknown class